MDFHARFKQLRKSRRWTQRELADRLNTSRENVNAWENVSAEPSYEKLVEIAALFRVSTDYLLGKENKEESHEQD